MALVTLTALEQSGELQSPGLRERCTRLAQALKEAVKGRSSDSDEFIDVESVASNSGLTPGWIFNAIESRLLDAVFPGRQWEAEVDWPLIKVSPTFGLTRL